MSGSRSGSVRDNAGSGKRVRIRIQIPNTGLSVQSKENYFVSNFITSQLMKKLKLSNLKGLSHEIEIGCRWYGCVDLYLERCCWQFINFLVAPSIFTVIQIKVL